MGSPMLMGAYNIMVVLYLDTPGHTLLSGRTYNDLAMMPWILIGGLKICLGAVGSVGANIMILLWCPEYWLGAQNMHGRSGRKYNDANIMILIYFWNISFFSWLHFVFKKRKINSTLVTDNSSVNITLVPGFSKYDISDLCKWTGHGCTKL